MKLGDVVLAALAAALAASGCSASKSASARKPRACPKAWRADWQRLANRVGAPVYCPTWLPDPLDGKIAGGQWLDVDSVDPRDHSYLISFLYHESSTGDIHVNLRGYPRRTTIPKCANTEFVDGRARRSEIPCFADPHSRTRIGELEPTLYTVNQGADQWHILYAWHRDGSLYTASQHVAAPLTYRQVTKDLKRVVAGLVLVRPKSS